MIRALLMRLTEGLPAREIRGPNDTDYLERYYVGRLFGWTFYLHRFLAPDPGTGLHNHPWDVSVSVVLAGGYMEHRLQYVSCEGVSTEMRHRFFGRPHIIRANDFHHITWLDRPETWTLFACRHRVQRWGFMNWMGPPEISKLVVKYRLYEGSNHLDWHETAPTGAYMRLQAAKRRAKTDTAA